MRTSDIETHKADRGHECHACGQRIERGETYMRYRLWDGALSQTVRMHIECLSAMHVLSNEDGEFTQWQRGEFARGCTCAHGECTHRVNGKVEQEGGVRA